MVMAGGSNDGTTDGSKTGKHSKTGKDSEELRLKPALETLDHATAWLEWPVRRIAGSARLNPLPHAGTMSVFLLGIVMVSGLYITLFFEYGHSASYESVASMEAHAIQRVVRALHRYASAALVITTVVHGWRILSARRFVGRQRRLRWVTGVTALVLVWMAGVTGYWLVWDVRAQALNEVMIGFIGDTDTGAGFAIDHLGVLGGRSGSGFLLTMWFLHLLLTAAIGFFAFRHLRRTNLLWLPPRHMMALMGGALLMASLLLPVGMLPPAEPQRLLGEIPIDPFVLFLLPPLLSEARWLVVLGAVVAIVAVMFLPRLLRRRDPEIIVIDEQACTGCELCVIDCPYQALIMNGSQDHPLAVVDEQRCVSCGICLGSCAFGAIDLPGFDQTPPLEVAGRPLVIACDRHDLSKTTDQAVIHPVACAGTVSPQTIRLFSERGATDIQIIGCAPNECRYGIGNTLAAERLDGRRQPHPAPKFARRVTQDWVPGDRLQEVLASPGSHRLADGRQMPRRREALLGVGVIAMATAAGVALATRAPFESSSDSSADAAEIRIVLHHQNSRALRAAPDIGPLGALSGIELRVDDRMVFDVSSNGPDGGWTEIVDVSLSADALAEIDSAGRETLSVYGLEDDTRTLLHRAPIDRRSTGSRNLIDLTDTPPQQTVTDGRRIFTSRAGGCDVCHSVEPGDDGVGPSLASVASVAGDRVEGLSAEQYFRQSILLPDQYIVDGWPAGQMLPIYRDRFSPEELDAVISYLLTLEAEPADQGEGDS